MSAETTTELTGRAGEVGSIREEMIRTGLWDDTDLRDPSRDIGAAWTIVERMLDHGSQRVYLAFVRAWTEQGVVAPGWVAARRICEAALAAVAAPGTEGEG